MKLRTYLVKRTLHMMITILIVLVLLFILYRMMPGNAAASMMMNPRMTPDQINIVLVRYGFGRWADYSGQYTVSNYNPQTIGRYNLMVEAVDDDTGQTDSFSTYFDVNAPEDMDIVAPTVLDIGFSTAPSIGQKADFYILAYDAGAVKSVEVNIVGPNHVVVDGVPVSFTETVTMNAIANMTDETNKTYYYRGTTSTVLALGEDGSSEFIVTYLVQDSARNVGTAAMTFDGITGNETSKIWNLSVDIPFANGIYTYPNVNQAITLSSSVIGANPTFSMFMSDNARNFSVPMTGPASNLYTGTYTVPENGKLTFTVGIGDIAATFPFAVNSIGTMPAAIEDDDAVSPVLSNLVVVTMDRNGREVVSPEYPFVLRDLRLRLNATALDSNGVRVSNVTAYVFKPDGMQSSMSLIHPVYVQMRTMAEQFVIYMKTMLVFDFGTSYIYQRSSWEVIVERIPSTALLFGSALVVSYVIGIMVGVVVAWRRGTVLEMGTIIVTLFFFSMPIFWFALIMQWVFYAQLGWFPLAGMGGIDAQGDPIQGFAYVIDVLWHLTMPLITLVILGLAGTILLMRAAMLEVMGEDFTTTAKAKGLKESTVVYKHVARNAMLPVVTSMAMSIGGIISGGVLTETIFSWYGMGTLLIEGTLSKDFPVVQGAFYILALLTIFGNMAADLLYAWLDPRVQL
ncbi:MAG: ABC transporter permease [Thermoplasmata archaeon]|nr:ABC transporter permease [Thermoplasmata archaeon]